MICFLLIPEWKDGFPVGFHVDNRPALRLRFVERLNQMTPIPVRRLCDAR
jgi:hypothetical protein